MTRMISYAKVLPSLMRELQHLGDQEISCTPQLGPSVDQNKVLLLTKFTLYLVLVITYLANPKYITMSSYIYFKFLTYL